jgi:hypothetical protein
MHNNVAVFSESHTKGETRPSEEGGHKRKVFSLDLATREALSKVPTKQRSETVEDAILLRQRLIDYDLAETPMQFDKTPTCIECIDTITDLLRLAMQIEPVRKAPRRTKKSIPRI